MLVTGQKASIFPAALGILGPIPIALPVTQTNFQIPRVLLSGMGLMLPMLFLALLTFSTIVL